MNVKKILIITSIAVVGLYAAFLIKKSFVDKGYQSEKDAKETLLSYYVIQLGLPDTQENRDKYRYMTLDDLKVALNLQDIIVE
jgi:hypothetical protein